MQQSVIENGNLSLFISMFSYLMETTINLENGSYDVLAARIYAEL